MKDNTAAVHVQVPVEVTSFLLNEKRTEITKIELKQRVTVLLVPEQAHRDAELQARAPAPRRPAAGEPAGQLHDDRGARRRGRHHAPREGQGQAGAGDQGRAARPAGARVAAQAVRAARRRLRRRRCGAAAGGRAAQPAPAAASWPGSRSCLAAPASRHCRRRRSGEPRAAERRAQGARRCVRSATAAAASGRGANGDAAVAGGRGGDRGERGERGGAGGERARRASVASGRAASATSRAERAGRPRRRARRAATSAREPRDGRDATAAERGERGEGAPQRSRARHAREGARGGRRRTRRRAAPREPKPVVEVQAEAPPRPTSSTRIPVGDGACRGRRTANAMVVAVAAAEVVAARRDEAAGFDGGNATGGESVDLAVPRPIGDEPTVAPTARDANAPRRRREERAPPMPSGAVAEERAPVEVAHVATKLSATQRRDAPCPRSRAAAAARPPVPRLRAADRRTCSSWPLAPACSG